MKEKYYNKGKDRCVGKVKELVEQLYFEPYNCYLEQQIIVGVVDVEIPNWKDLKTVTYQLWW